MPKTVYDPRGQVPDGKIGRVAVVLSGGDWTLVRRVA